MKLYCETPSLSRRQMLAFGGSLIASSFIPKFARAADGRDPRFIAIILRGAMDGLSAIAPTGDPDYASLHGDLALTFRSQSWTSPELLLHFEPGDDQLRAPIQIRPGRSRARNCHGLSRSFSL